MSSIYTFTVRGNPDDVAIILYWQLTGFGDILADNACLQNGQLRVRIYMKHGSSLSEFIQLQSKARAKYWQNVGYDDFTRKN